MTTPSRTGRTGWLAWLGVVALASTALAQAKVPEHEASKALSVADQRRDCLACHPSEKDQAKLTEPTRSCDANCVRCHKDVEKHHPVGPEVEERDKVSLPLLGDKKVGCISCHDLKTARTDTRSWKSQSLFARMFQSQRTYKTYYLRINNSDGKLCKSCH